MIPSTDLSLFRVKTLCFLSLLLFLSVYSFAQGGKVDSSQMVTLRIDPQNARGAAVSQVFDDVKFIPLETTKESLFGNIHDFKIVKNRFVIYDYDTKAVLIFDRDGKFKGKIDASKIPKDDADKSKPDLWGYNIKEDNKDSVIAIRSNKYYFYFNLDGKQIKRVTVKEAEINRGLVFADKETIVRQSFLEKKGKDSTFYELGIIRKNKDSVGYFPFSMKRYEKDQFYGSSRLYDYEVKNELLFVNVYSYNIYKVTPAKLSLAYRVIFPANNSLPRDFMDNPMYVGKRWEYFQKNQKVFYSMNNTYLVGNNLYLQMRNYAGSRDSKNALIYNLKASEIISLQDLTPDSLSSFLPVTDAGTFGDFASRGFHIYKDGYFYTNYSSLAMFSFKQQLGDKNKKFTPQMEEYFKTQNRKSNPIIVMLKPKKN